MGNDISRICTCNDTNPNSGEANLVIQQQILILNI